jgi:hypothetical protein
VIGQRKYDFRAGVHKNESGAGNSPGVDRARCGLDLGYSAGAAGVGALVFLVAFFAAFFAGAFFAAFFAGAFFAAFFAGAFFAAFFAGAFFAAFFTGFAAFFAAFFAI